MDHLRLFDVIQSEGIIFRLDATDRDQALLDIVMHLVHQKRIPAKDADDIYVNILKREAVASTGIGDGVAVPHIRTNLVRDFVGCLALSKRGIDFGGGERAKVVFMFLSPVGRQREHLLLLGRIGSLFIDREFIDRLLAARDEDDLEEVLRSAEERLYGDDNDSSQLAHV